MEETEVIFEEFEKTDNFVTIFDDDGMITIQISEHSLKKIIEEFDSNIKQNIDCDAIIDIIEFGEDFKLELSLETNATGFSLTGSTVGGNFYNDFELEYCSYENWEKIKKLVLE